MASLTLVCWGLMAVAAADGAPPAATGSKAYDEARAQLGRGAEGQLRLALWCEAHGLNAEKLRHLAAAVLGDPASATARALMGMVDDGGKWRDPQAVAARVQADEALSKALAAYNARRDKTPNTADAQWKLALWCEENGLKDEAAAHLTTVVRLDPSREAAWKRLGYARQRNGRWMTPEQVMREKADRDAFQKADILWKTRIEQWRAALAHPAERDAAARALEGIADPLAVPAIWRVFVTGKKPDQARAVAMLGRIDGPMASQALAVLAVRGNSPEVRRAAKETLVRRDPREFLDGLIALFRDPLKPYKPPLTAVAFKPLGADFVGSPGYVWYREGNTIYEHGYTVDESTGAANPADVLRPVYVPPGANPKVAALQNLAAQVANQQGPANPARTATAAAFQHAAANVASQPIGYAPGPRAWDYGWRAGIQNMVIMATAANLQAAPLQAAEAVAMANAATAAVNREVDDTLHAITGSDPGHDSESWRAWWVDQQGYAYERRPPEPIVEEEPTPGPITVVSTGWTHLSCFAARTPVKTIGGYTPIEAVKVGDRLLTQDPDTGRLTFQPVIAVYHNKPSATLRIAFEGGSTIVATGIHRFWKAGQGWVMARELKPGDPIRTVGGLDRVKRVSDDVVQPVFNLEVARGRSFFVGEGAALVHDNSLVDPVTTPFDAVPELAAAARQP